MLRNDTSDGRSAEFHFGVACSNLVQMNISFCFIPSSPEKIVAETASREDYFKLDLLILTVSYTVLVNFAHVLRGLHLNVLKY